MNHTPQRVRELLQTIPWQGDACIRLFWIRHSQGSRDEFAAGLAAQMGSEAVVALVLRTHSFYDSNAVLADVISLFEANKKTFVDLSESSSERITVLVLAKEEFRLAQASSPITLPDWFPVCPASETHFYISDLGQTAEVEPLNCPEARSDNVSQLVYQLEEAIVRKLREVQAIDPPRVYRFLVALNPSGPKNFDPQPDLDLFKNHMESIADERAYRPNAATESKFLVARMLKIVLNTSPKQLGVISAELGESLNGSQMYDLKPTFFAAIWRPANKISVAANNWNGVLVAFYHAYQMLNASAHAGEFPKYSVALQFSTSLNLRRSLLEAKDFVDSLS